MASLIVRSRNADGTYFCLRLNQFVRKKYFVGSCQKNRLQQVLKVIKAKINKSFQILLANVRRGSSNFHNSLPAFILSWPSTNNHQQLAQQIKRRKIYAHPQPAMLQCFHECIVETNNRQATRHAWWLAGLCSWCMICWLREMSLPSMVISL